MPDDLDRKILSELRKDARASMRSIAQRLGVSTPTVSQRVRRMEETGLIVGYRVVTAMDLKVKASPIAEWKCVHCGGPIRGKAVVRNVGEKHRPFCCPICAGLFEERYEKLEKQARR